MAESTVTKKLGPNPTRKEILANWTPEDPVFWKKFGEKIAKQNLYTSTWALVLSFVVWTLWATIAAKLNMVGFHFTDEQLFTLAALPGLVGATGRLFYTYLPGLIGGRNSAFITTALLLLPLFGLGRALQDPTTSYDTFVLLVSFIGIAGANFSASMANIGFFFPKAHKGLALGINAGVGNLGVSLIYLTAPLLLGWNLSSFFGPGVETPNGMMYVQNVCYFWTVPTALTLVLIWMFMDNLPLPKIEEHALDLRQQAYLAHVLDLHLRLRLFHRLLRCTRPARLEGIPRGLLLDGRVPRTVHRRRHPPGRRLAR